MTFKALVVGLGQIGMGFDLNLDPDVYALTHARAFQRHSSFQLAGGVDPNLGRRQLFEKHYGAPAYADVESAVKALQPDVVAVSSPTSEHHASVHAVLAAGRPAAILCEKPLAYQRVEAREIVEATAEQGCKLFVNYMRRADCGVVEVKRRLDAGLISHPIKGVTWYSKGLFNNGSHFLNLLQYWLGGVTDFRILEPGRLWDGLDPEPDVAVTFKLGTMFFLAVREENYSHYTAELVAPNGRLRYEQGGERIFWQGTVKDAACEGYTILDPVGESIETDFTRVQWHVVDQLAASLSGHQAHICSGAEALQTLEILAEVKSKL